MKSINKYLLELSSNDEVMAVLIKNHSPIIPTESLTPFNDLIRSIISQQLSVKAAQTIYNRFIVIAGSTYDAEVLRKMDIEKIRSVGISYQKCGYIKNVTEKFIENPQFFLYLKNCSDDEVIKELIRIKGVGKWTAKMFLMFTLVRLDILPLADIGIQNAVQKFYKLNSKPNPIELQNIASNWKPYRTIACWYLWSALDS